MSSVEHLMVSANCLHYNAKPLPIGTAHEYITVTGYVVLRYEGTTKVGYVCRCACGKFCVRTKQNVFTQHSCGCQKRRLIASKKRTHGLTGTPTWWSWMSMRHRCLDRANVGWKHYGGRGITVCKRWLNSFENFLADMGERPEGRTLDRINNDGNYTPRNCRWATLSEQAKNQRPRVRFANGQFGGLA